MWLVEHARVSALQALSRKETFIPSILMSASTAVLAQMLARWVPSLLQSNIWVSQYFRGRPWGRPLVVLFFVNNSSVADDLRDAAAVG